jgi:hypothetical protein
MTDEDFIWSPTQFCSIAVEMIGNGLDEWFRASQGDVPGVIAVKPAGVLVCSSLDAGRHRVAGITPENNASVAPARQRLAVQNRPRAAVWADFQHSANISMEAFLRLA